VLNLIKHYTMKMYGEVDLQIHIFLTSALVGGQYSVVSNVKRQDNYEWRIQNVKRQDRGLFQDYPDQGVEWLAKRR
jgi:hypothetical protein